jgi:hypothetical protein
LQAERDALRAELDRVHTRRAWGARARAVGVTVLVVLACLSLTMATVAFWANRTLLDTDGWVATVGPLAGEPAITAALQPRITDEVFNLIPAQDALTEALPDQVAFLAVPLSSAIRSFVDDQVGAFLNSSTFETLWTDANRIAHEQVLALLRGDDSDVVIEGDTVTLNLLPTINAVLGEISSAASGLLGRDVTLPQLSSGEVPAVARAKLSQELGIQLPSNLGAIPVYQGDEVAAAQQAVLLFDNLRVFLIIATPLLIVGALWLSRNRRRTLLQLATGSVLLLVIVRRLTMRATEAVVDLPPLPAGQRAARVVADQVLDGLFSATGTVIVVGLALVVLALLTGPYGWAVTLRRTTVNVARTVTEAGGRVTSGVDTDGVVAWVEARRSALQLGGVLAAVLLLLVFDLSWWWFLAVLALLACFELLVWRLRAPPPPEPTEAFSG